MLELLRSFKTFYGGIIWVWEGQVGEKFGAMTMRRDGWKIMNFSKFRLLDIQSDLKESRGLPSGY